MKDIFEKVNDAQVAMTHKDKTLEELAKNYAEVRLLSGASLSVRADMEAFLTGALAAIECCAEIAEDMYSGNPTYRDPISAKIRALLPKETK